MSFLDCAISRTWPVVLPLQWLPDRQSGRMDWGPDNATLEPPDVDVGDSSESSCESSPSSRAALLYRHFFTGGMSTKFDATIRDMLHLARFNLLTHGVCVRTREQYTYCSERMGQFRSCLDVSPWLPTALPGWVRPAVAFLAWVGK